MERFLLRTGPKPKRSISRQVLQKAWKQRSGTAENKKLKEQNYKIIFKEPEIKKRAVKANETIVDQYVEGGGCWAPCGRAGPRTKVRQG